MNKKMVKEKKERKPRRTNEEIYQDIFDAVHKIVKLHGFTKLSISLISEFSGVSILIITSKFRTLDNIIKQYLERFDILSNTFYQDQNTEATKDALNFKLESILDLAWKKKEIQQLFAWEMIEESDLLKPMIMRQEILIGDILSQYINKFKDSKLDIQLIFAILLSSIFYLSGYKYKNSFCGLDLTRHNGNLLVSNIIKQIIDVIYDKLEKNTEKSIASRLLKLGDPVEKIMEITGLSEEEILSASTSLADDKEHAVQLSPVEEIKSSSVKNETIDSDSIINRLNEINNLSDYDKSHIIYTLDALINNVKLKTMLQSLNT